MSSQPRYLVKHHSHCNSLMSMSNSTVSSSTTRMTQATRKQLKPADSRQTCHSAARRPQQGFSQLDLRGGGDVEEINNILTPKSNIDDMAEYQTQDMQRDKTCVGKVHNLLWHMSMCISSPLSWYNFLQSMFFNFNINLLKHLYLIK